MKIGVLTDLGGPYSDASGRGSVIAAEMAVRDFGGTVLGRPVTIISADHQGKPDVAVATARRWYDAEGVDVIADLAGSPIALAVQAVAAEKKRISLTSTAAADPLTNARCSPYGAHWTFDSYSLVKTLAAGFATPGSTWFILATDNDGGRAMARSIATILNKAGARIVGQTYHPLGTADMSSFLLQAQASGAKYIALGNGGADLVNAVKQAGEFGLTSHGQTVVAFATHLTDLKAMGLATAKGLVFPMGFVSEQSAEAAEWSRRFFGLHGTMPNDSQAGVYSAVLHYLRAVKAAGTDDADAVMAKMREMPIDDMFARGGVLRKDGRMVHDMYLVQAKRPDESTGPWDLVRILKTVPGAEAFRPLSESECPLARNP